MYQPQAFREDRVEVLHQVIHRSRLATVVTLHSDGMVASHVPLLLEETPGPYGTLLGHLARPNPQAKGVVSGLDALAIFQPIEGYVTPSWYETKRETGKVVPTWNYVAVHAYGPIAFFTDRDRLLDVVTRLTQREEGRRDMPWGVSDAPADYIDGMLRGIVGFSIPITRIEGKWKMSQNRPEPDVAGVIAGFRTEGRDDLAKVVAIATGHGHDLQG